MAEGLGIQLIQEPLRPLPQLIVEVFGAMGTIQVSVSDPRATLGAEENLRQDIEHSTDSLVQAHLSIRF